MALTLIIKTTRGGRLLMYSFRFSRGLMLNIILISSTPPRWAAARPGPGPASCSADARGRSQLTRGGARRARGRSAPSSPRGPGEGRRPVRLTPGRQTRLGLRQPWFPGRKNATANAAATSDTWRPTAARPGQASAAASGRVHAPWLGHVGAGV